MFTALVIAAPGCEQRLDSELDGPLTFEVEIVAGDAGTAEAPRPFSGDPVTFEIDIRAVDLDGQPADWFAGPVRLGVEPVGELAKGQVRDVELVDGRAARVPVALEGLHGSATIWVEDQGADEAPGSYATGLSPLIHVVHPTIRQLQEGKHHETSALNGDFVELEVAGRAVVVTGITKDGFYATDTAEVGGVYAGIFVYSFSRPAVEIGDTLGRLSGTAEEYYGFTELSFPSWKVAGTAELPPAIEIDEALLAEDALMEQYEGGVVEVRDVVVCPLEDDYATYGQWSVLVDPDGLCAGGLGAISVVSAFTAPGFDPAAHVGQGLARLTGNLRYHMAANPKWIIYVRDDGDIVAADD